MSDPRRVLLIEDDAAQATALTALLRQHGLAVDVARTVDDALERLAVTTPTCVVLDWYLDRSAEAVRAVLVRRGIPVVVVTGATNDPPSLPNDANWEVLLKPYEVEQLVPIIARMMLTAPDVTGALQVQQPSPTGEGRDSAPPPPLARTNPAVAVAHYRWRTMRAAVRLGGTICMSAITMWFEHRGHPPPLPALGMIAAVAIGLGSAVTAIKQRPITTVGGAGLAAMLIALSAGTGLPGFETAVAFLGSALPVIHHTLEQRSAA